MKTVKYFGIEVEDVRDFIENEPNIYSQAHQDLFALGISNYKTNGTFVDIACAQPRDCNNTYFLEHFDWTGISLDIKNYKHLWEQTRKNKFLHGNALQQDYKQLFKENFKTNKIDYLSLDADDITNTVLTMLPFDEYEFNCITIEHDLYANGDISKKQYQYDFLNKRGYKCIANNICVFEKHCVAPFEDWWVSSSIYEKYLNLFNKQTSPYYYSDELLNQYEFFINRYHIIKNKQDIINRSISEENTLKCLATQTLDINNKEINLINRPTIIFLPYIWIENFIDKILPSIKYNFTLLTYKRDNDFIELKNVESLLDNNFLKKWYTSTLLFKHPKISHPNNINVFKNEK
jgi:hypothetical protein